MKKILLSSLCLVGLVSASASTGFKTKVGAKAIVAFAQGVKTEGNVGLGKDFFSANQGAAVEADLAGAGSIYKTTPRALTDYSKKDNVKGKVGFGGALSIDGIYYFSPSVGVGLNFGADFVGAKLEDKVNKSSAKTSYSLSIAPCVCAHFADKFSVSVFAGIAWTEVKNLEYINGTVKADAAGVALSSSNTLAAGTLNSGTYYSNFHASDAGVKANMIDAVGKITTHNKGLIKNKFDMKPGFTAGATVAMDLDGGFSVGAGYKFTKVKVSKKDSLAGSTDSKTTHSASCNLHTISLQVTYAFNLD